jgi:hypothetical protein
MSLLDDARTLFDKLDRGGDGPWVDDGPREMICLACGTNIVLERQPPDCPWNSMPRIVAALEAAERLSAAWQMPGASRPIPGSMGGFDIDWERGKARHEAIRDAEQALGAALKGTQD